MHELSLCRAIYSITERAAAGREVVHVHLDVGMLRQVIPETLAYCWGIVTEETPLTGSQLAINHIPGVIECQDCTARTRMFGIPTMRCGSCGCTKVSVVSGEEFLLRSLDVKDAEAPGATDHTVHNTQQDQQDQRDQQNQRPPGSPGSAKLETTKTN